MNLVNKMSSEKLVLVTGNKNKLKEFQSVLNNYDLESVALEIDEIQGSSEEVIIAKAKSAYNQLKKRCIVEDTSFGFEEWNWLPGPYIKDFIENLGYEKLVHLTNNKSAKTLCLIALANSQDDIKVFKGEVFGKVVESKGDKGFAFDKVFIPEGYNKRFSEMSFEEKNSVSHRYKAICESKNYLVK